MESVDMLQIKIDKARAALPKQTLTAIDAVDWKAVIARMVGKKGYSVDQLGTLELETELLLCGLITPEAYPKELENRMGINAAQATELVNDMNENVFKKIRDNLMGKTGNPKQAKTVTQDDGLETREEILKRLETPEISAPHPLIAQKLSGPMKTSPVKTEHTLENLSPASSPAGAPEQKSTPPVPPAPKKYEVDPYREKPE